MGTKDGGKTVQATETTLLIVDEIKSADTTTLTKLSETLDIAKSTAHAHLNTLKQHGFVVNENGEYRLGQHFYHIGEHAKRHDPAFELVEQKVHELADSVDNQPTFLTESHGRVILLFKPYDDQASVHSLGTYYPMHTGSVGKSILAALSTTRIKEIIDRWGLPELTKNTITNTEDLLDELEFIRERGYATNDQESEEGYCSVGTAIRRPNGFIVGGLSIGGPAYDMTPEHRSQVAERHLLPAARELESDIASAISQ